MSWPRERLELRTRLNFAQFDLVAPTSCDTSTICNEGIIGKCKGTPMSAGQIHVQV